MTQNDHKNLWQVLSKETVHKNPWFLVENAKVAEPDGTVLDYYIVDYTHNSVGILAIQDGSILLVRQHRFIVDIVSWEIPAGNIDSGETAQQAAQRELFEETGVHSTCDFLTTVYPSFGVNTQRMDLFTAQVSGKIGRNFDKNEVIACKWFTFKEVRTMLEKGEIVDGMSQAGLWRVICESFNKSSDNKQNNKK